jgi:hypothetical protein
MYGIERITAKSDTQVDIPRYLQETLEVLSVGTEFAHITLLLRYRLVGALEIFDSIPLLIFFNNYVCIVLMSYSLPYPPTSSRFD